MASGWAPYTTGRWVWVAPWGWTWVDEAPGLRALPLRALGLCRFELVLGAGHLRAPAGLRAGAGGLIGGPHFLGRPDAGRRPAVGWVPLAPREVYVPTYRVSPGYVRNVNYTHVTNITNITTIVNNLRRRWRATSATASSRMR